MERLTVNLTQRAVDCLRDSAEISESNKTDVVNKALILYNFMLKIDALNGSIYVRERSGDDLERIRIF